MDTFKDTEEEAEGQDVKPGSKPTVTKDATITARIAAATAWFKPNVNKSNRCSNRYLDSSARTLFRDASYDAEIHDLPVGEINTIAMNIRQKVAAIGIGAPDVVVKLQEGAPAEYGELVRKYIRETWLKKKWGRIFRRMLTQRYVSGMGHVAFLWDRNKGFEIEFVETRDVGFDPCTTQDTWDDPRWGYRVVNVPIDVAKARYSEEVLQQAETEMDEQSFYRNVLREKLVYCIYVYQDETCEAEIYGSTVLRKGPNLYGRVGVRTLVGDVNPNGEFPLGDFDTSLGMFEMQRRLQNIINNTASNGGGIPWLRSEYIDEKIRQKVINGTHNGYVLVTGVPGDQAVGYTANNPLSDAVLSAMQMMQQGLESDQGVTNLDRGVTDNVHESATQTALRANRSGGRGQLARIDYEQFVEALLNDMVKLTAKFGYDPLSGDLTDEAGILLEACEAVTEVRVIEESASFKDPALLQQQNLTLFQLASSVFPLMAQVGAPINLKALFDDLLRSFDKRDTDKYYLSQQEQMAMQQQQMMAQMQQAQATGGGVPGQPGSAPPQGGPPPQAGQPGQAPVAGSVAQ